MEDLKMDILNYKAEFTPESLTEEEIEKLEEIRGIKRTKEQPNIKDIEKLEEVEIEEIELLKDLLKGYALNIDNMAKAKDTQIESISDKYNQETINQMEQEISLKNREERKKLADKLYKQLDIVLEYQTAKVDRVEEVGEIPDSAIKDIELIKMLDEVSQEDMQRLVSKYKNNQLVVKVLSQEGKKHNIYFKAKDIKEVKKEIGLIEKEVKDFIENYNPLSFTYGHRVLITDNGNRLDMRKEIIDNFINGDIEVAKGYGS